MKLSDHSTMILMTAAVLLLLYVVFVFDPTPSPEPLSEVMKLNCKEYPNIFTQKECGNFWGGTR